MLPFCYILIINVLNKKYRDTVFHDTPATLWTKNNLYFYYFSVYNYLTFRAFKPFYLCAGLGDIYFQDVVFVSDLERITVPFFGQDSLEREHSVLYSHSAETLNYRHPSAAHRSYVAAVASVVVVIVQIEAARVEIILVCLVVKSDFCRQNIVNATWQRTFVNRKLLVKFKIALDCLHVKIVFKEINSLQNVSLLDVATS